MGCLGVAITDIYYVLDKELRDVIYDSDERSKKVRNIIASLHINGNEVIRRTIASILFNLYDYKVDLLETDLCRLIMFSDSDQDRVELKDKFTYLRVIMPIIRRHFNGDYRVLLGEIRRWHDDYGNDYDMNDLPFN